MKTLSSSRKKKIIQQLEDQFGTIQSQIDKLGVGEKEVKSKLQSFV